MRRKMGAKRRWRRRMGRMRRRRRRMRRRRRRKDLIGKNEDRLLLECDTM